MVAGRHHPVFKYTKLISIIPCLTIIKRLISSATDRPSVSRYVIYGGEITSRSVGF